jgi:phage-related protein (TIGR01555 family)
MNNLNDIFGFVWELLAGSARMPKSHVLGQQQGVITGGSYDSLNYYSRIENMQKDHLTPVVEQIIDWLLIASDSGVGAGSLNPDEVEYEIVWNPLWQLSAAEASKVDKTNAEIDKTYVELNVTTPDEVRKKRLGLDGLGLDYDPEGDNTDDNTDNEEDEEAAE